MIDGVHAVVYSANAQADRALLRDGLGLPKVDVGDGWPIFGLPPAEVAVHPSDRNDVHELYLICDDIEVFVAEMNEQGIDCEPAVDQGWGLLARMVLPGCGKLGVYQTRHARPEAPVQGQEIR